MKDTSRAIALMRLQFPEMKASTEQVLQRKSKVHWGYAKSTILKIYLSEDANRKLDMYVWNTEGWIATNKSGRFF